MCILTKAICQAKLNMKFGYGRAQTKSWVTSCFDGKDFLHVCYEPKKVAFVVHFFHYFIFLNSLLLTRMASVETVLF